MTTRQQIDEKLRFLHRHPDILAKQPPALRRFYIVPPDLRKEALCREFSEDSLQKVSDDIGRFLGIPSVKLTVGVESSGYLPGVPGQIEDRADRAGLYAARGTFAREIQLTKKYRFGLEHVIAILAHESTHCLLDHCQLREVDQHDHEVLTDVAAAYVGLGGVILEGYHPVVWTSGAGGQVTHSLSIGYVRPEGIRYAIAKSAQLRGLKQLSKWQIRALLEKLDRTESLYERISGLMAEGGKNTSGRRIQPEHARKLVEIANELSLGQIEHALRRLSPNVISLKDSPGVWVGAADLAHLSAQLGELSKTVSQWGKLVRKYVR